MTDYTFSADGKTGIFMAHLKDSFRQRKVAVKKTVLNLKFPLSVLCFDASWFLCQLITD